MSLKKAICVGVTTLFGVGAAGLAQADQAPIRIGYIADQTGPYAGNGGPGAAIAIRMAIEDFGGKLLGKPIDLRVADDQNKPDVGTGIVREWIEHDHVNAVLSGSGSAIALATSSLTKKYQTPLLLIGPRTPDLTNKACSPMNVQFTFDTYTMAKAGVKNLTSQGLKTFFFITVDYKFGSDMQADAEKYVTQFGGKVLGSVKHPLGTTDFSSYLMQAQASGAQAIVLLSAGSDLDNELKQAAEYRITKNGQKIAIFGMTEHDLMAMGLEETKDLTFPVPAYWDENAQTRAFSKRFQARNNGVIPTYMQIEAYSAMSHYLKAVTAAGTLDGPAVIGKMKAIPVNDFSIKNASVRADGQVAFPMYTVVVKSPAESKSKYDYYKIGGPLNAEDIYRPLTESNCYLAENKSI
ncbi:ABC transporter substrate-binding protein [Paraburkholderia unamae]|uniref:Amino acid/amide ABC transporter substrate-binding protein (HAAT family) n=1 Tax=Paraburkholderia unamae TaxID=219649 RepID=A0ABX5KVR9_9BURK|nr:ABC transporter substrate-binding protein [Paraburkholderia unamae]PVX84938.1 amino acid/amide ABC transporter substrate-binding protein (HAAT family) [Paraburkholderia unamae]CAG9266687.1 ABC transporter permease [Paraburkholderia unamae]